MKALINTGASQKLAPPSALRPGLVDLPLKKHADEILIKVKAAAVNRADLLQRKGLYPPQKGVTETIGLECSGEVVDWVTLKSTGEQVMALLPGGGYADYVSVKRGHT